MDNGWKDQQDTEKEQGSEEQYSFLQETVKDEQKKPKKIFGDICKTAFKGLVFGIVACIAFTVCRPWMEPVFQREDEKLTIPEDDETVEENLEVQEENPETFTIENYREMQKSLTAVATEANKCVVVVGLEKEMTDIESQDETSESVSGVIIWKNMSEILVAAPSRIIESGKPIAITFCDNKVYQASLKKQDKNSRLAVFSVSAGAMKDSTKSHIREAVLGNSNVMGKGMPVITLGNQFGYAGGSGYGIVSSTGNFLVTADRQYKLLTTDITANENGSGILFNIDGEVIGIADQPVTGVDSKNLVTGYAISGIKDVLECLSNGEGVPYLGIKGIEVTEEISENQGIPRGVYVKEIEADSPAMQAGIQNGDIVVELNGKEVKSLYEYQNELATYEVGQVIKMEVQRQGTEAYVDVSLKVTVGSKE